MKKLIVITASTYLALVSGVVLAADDNGKLLNSFHNYGITKCDKFIIKNSGLESHWNYFISRHADDISDTVKEASVIQIYGSVDDTVKTDDSYIQSKNGCFLDSRSTITHSGPCKDHVDMDSWYVSKEMPGKDYTQYTNKGGVTMQVKEISVGNFKACIKETTRRDSVPLE